MYIDILKRGTLEMLILQLLCENDAYGYQLSQSLSARTQGLITIQDGALYPLLYRLSEQELITGREELIKTSTGKTRIRVIYTITDAGKEQLKLEKQDFERLYTSIHDFFSSSTANTDTL